MTGSKNDEIDKILARAKASLDGDAREQAGKDAKANSAIDAVGKAAAQGGYKKLKYGIKDFFKTVGAYLVGTKVAKAANWIYTNTGAKWLWNKTNPSKFQWKSAETPWKTFKNRCKKIGGITTRAWLLAWPLSIIPSTRQLPLAGDFIAGAQEVGRYWTWEPAIDLFRMSLGAIKGDGFIKKEVVYLNSKSQIDIEEDIWGLQGTRQKGSMHEDDAVFYKAENRLIPQIWNLANHGSLWLARDKTAPVLIGGSDQAAEVLSYGGDWRLATWLQAKPYFLEMRPVSGAFNNEAGQTRPEPAAPAPVQQTTPVAPAPAGR